MIILLILMIITIMMIIIWKCCFLPLAVQACWLSHNKVSSSVITQGRLAKDILPFVYRRSVTSFYVCSMVDEQEHAINSVLVVSSWIILYSSSLWWTITIKLLDEKTITMAKRTINRRNKKQQVLQFPLSREAPTKWLRLDQHARKETDASVPCHLIVAISNITNSYYCITSY